MDKKHLNFQMQNKDSIVTLCYFIFTVGFAVKVSLDYRG
jgi:hypothetical protein